MNHGFNKCSYDCSFEEKSCIVKKMPGYNSVGPKAKNLLVAGGLTGFVFGTYFYTMRAVGSIDEVQSAIDRLEVEKRREEEKETVVASKA